MARTSLSKLHGPGKASFAEIGALLGVREMLKTGFLKDAKGAMYPQNMSSDHLVNMSQTCMTNEHCGSVGCLGGTMAMIMGDDNPHRYVMNRNHMDEPDAPEAKFWGPLFFPPLFFPPQHVVDYASITPRQMLKAIDNFISTGGKPLWEKVLTKKQLRGA